MWCVMTDREQIQFLRMYVYGIGHTDGTPFEAATLTLDSGRPYNIYGMPEILELIKRLNMVACLGDVTASDRFVYIWLKHHGIIDAFAALQQEIAKRESTIPTEVDGDISTSVE